MTQWSRIALVAGAAALVSGCRSDAEASSAEASLLSAREQRLAAQLDSPAVGSVKKPLAMWIMPKALREISGLALTSDGRLLAHDDEIAKIYEIDARKGVILKSFMLGKGIHGDFEGITIAGSEIFLLMSKGVLYQFREGGNEARVPYTKHDTKLGKECEFEGVVYEQDSAWLVLPCKIVHTKDLQDDLVLYRWKIGSSNKEGLSMLTVPLSEVIGSNKWKKFRPSDITIDPATGNYVLISSLDKGIAVVTPGGDVVWSGPLPGKHHQPEGVAITRDSVLIISDEGSSKPAAITLYRWHVPAPGEGLQ